LRLGMKLLLTMEIAQSCLRTVQSQKLTAYNYRSKRLVCGSPVEALFILSETLLAQHTTRATRSSVFGLYNTVGGFTEAVGPALGTGLVILARLAAPFLAGALVSFLSIIAILPVSDVAPDQAVLTPTSE
jgi:hypothetical protein